MKIYVHTFSTKINKINSLDSKFKYQILKYRLKNKFMTSYKIKKIMILKFSSSLSKKKIKINTSKASDC